MRRLRRDQPASGSHGTNRPPASSLRQKDVGLAVLEHLKTFAKKIRGLRAFEAIG